MPTQGPKGFNKEIYKDTLKLLRQYRDKFPEDAEIELAKICGGKVLVNAIDPDAVPPCGEDTDCLKCWLEDWCMHIDKSADERLAAVLGLMKDKPKKKEEEEPPTEFDPSIGMDDIL